MIEIRDFTHKGKTYILKEPLKLSIEGNCASNDDLGILVVVYKAMEGQVEAFAKQQLSDLWSAYAECRDEELSDSGLEFKRKLTDMVA